MSRNPNMLTSAHIDSNLTDRVRATLSSEFIAQVCFGSESSWAFEALVKYMNRVDANPPEELTDKFILHVESAIKCAFKVNQNCSKLEAYFTNKYGEQYEKYMFETVAA